MLRSWGGAPQQASGGTGGCTCANGMTLSTLAGPCPTPTWAAKQRSCAQLMSASKRGFQCSGTPGAAHAAHSQQLPQVVAGIGGGGRLWCGRKPLNVQQAVRWHGKGRLLHG